MKIMTGKNGTPHVTSQQFRQLIEGTVGQESYILTSGENLEPELQTNNLLKIRSGMMSHHGNLSVVDLGTYDEVTIQNGTQGMQRIDLVVNRYTQDEETGIEKNEWIVIQGTPAASNPQVPAYTEGNLQEGDLVDDCPVFEVHLNGINVTEVGKLLDIVPNITELNGNLTDAILIRTYTKENVIISANSYETVGVNAPVISGYTRTIWWADCTNSSTGGVNMSATNVYRVSVSTGEDNVNVAVKNAGGSQAKVDVVLRMIYTRDPLVDH